MKNRKQNFKRIGMDSNSSIPTHKQCPKCRIQHPIHTSVCQCGHIFRTKFPGMGVQFPEIKTQEVQARTSLPNTPLRYLTPVWRWVLGGLGTFIILVIIGNVIEEQSHPSLKDFLARVPYHSRNESVEHTIRDGNEYTWLLEREIDSEAIGIEMQIDYGHRTVLIINRTEETNSKLRNAIKDSIYWLRRGVSDEWAIRAITPSGKRIAGD
jgi:hypothetical protein